MAKKKKENILFFVEGQTEKSLLEALNILGVKREVNLWEIDIAKYLRRLNANTTIYIVYDTDVTNEWRRFASNLNKLKKNKHVTALFLLQQTKNLEDELMRSCSKSLKQLCQTFKAQDVTELKSKLCQVNNLADKLNQLDFVSKKCWQGQQLSELASWEKYRTTFEALEQK